MKLRASLAALLLVVLAIAVSSWLRGPQPDLGPPPAGADALALRLVSAARATLDGQQPELPRDLDGTWYVTAWPTDGGDPVTVEASRADWTALGLAGEARVQVDLAVADPPASPTLFGGVGLDVGLDGWIEDDGTVHLPVELQLKGLHQASLATFFADHPGRPLRTWAWVEDEQGRALRSLRGSVDPGPTSSEMLRARADLAGDYLVRHLRADGMFDYEWSARRGMRQPGYNMLRHAGTVYSMFALYGHTWNEEHYQAAARGLDWLAEQTVPSALDPGSCLATDQGKAKLGGSALVLLALTEQARVRPSAARYEWMSCLGRHLVRQVQDDGELASYSTDGGRFYDPGKRSSYYPGEALFALTRLNEVDPQPEWEEAIDKAAAWLIHEQWTGLGFRIKVLGDAWMALGLERVHARTGDPDVAAHVFKIGETLASWQLMAPNIPADLRGAGYRLSAPNVVSAGSRGEGLGAVAALERRVRPGQTRYYDMLEASVRFSLRNQYTEPVSIGLRRPGQALGGFRDSPRDATVRIDGVQHNLSAILGLLRLIEEAP